MYMHQNPGRKSWKDLQVNSRDIAAHPHHVTGVDKQDVARLQRGTQASFYMLNRFRDYRDQISKNIAPHVFRVRIDRDQSAYSAILLLVSLQGRDHNSGTVSGANLNYVLGASSVAPYNM